MDRRSGSACQPRGPVPVVSIAVLCAALSACASGAGADGDGRHFSDISLGSRPPPAVAAAVSASPPILPQATRAPAAPSRSAAPATAAIAAAQTPGFAAASVAEAERRLDVWLSATGFREETAGSGGGVRVTAERMATQPSGDAVCALRALDRPQMYAVTVDVRLDPAPAGVEVGVQARFVELDQNLVSGALVKRVCRSRGLLEAAVQRAVRGG